jgi:hypothetical protein
LLIPVLLGIGGVLLLQRVTPLARIWSFLLPVCLMLASAGLVGGVRIILASQKTRPWQTPVFLVALFLISTSLIWSTIQEQPESKDEYYGPVRETEQIARQLADQVIKGDVIAANSPVQAPLRFYLLGLGISDTSFYNKQDPSSFESALPGWR